MSERQGFFETIADHFVPIHSDGHKFLAVGLGLMLLGFLVWSPLGWLFALLTAWLAFFFRDPDRVTPLREGLVVAPADGRVSQIEKVLPPSEFGFTDGMERTRISIVLSIFDVHINRSPVAGRIARSLYVPGAFLNPTLDKASEDNERRALIIAMPSGDEIAVVQIAGVISRRIVTFAHEGDSVGVGQRFGLIRFGSRLDLYLPPDRHPLVSVGQRAVAGETVIADLRSDEPEREARRS